MLAQGWTSPAEQAETKIRQYVGEFLAARARITRVQQSADLKTRNKASNLLLAQKQLEGRLDPVMKMLDQLKTGAFNIGIITTIGIFATDMLTHLKDVEDLEREAKGLKPISTTFSTQNILTFLALSGMGFMYMQMRKSRRV